MEINKEELFPIEIYTIRTNIDTQYGIDYINSIKGEFYYRKEAGGYQGGIDIDDYKFKDIQRIIDSSIQQTFNTSHEMLEIWVSILTNGDYNKIHNHPSLNPMYYSSDIYAGILYLQTNNKGVLTIHSNTNVTDSRNILVQDGDLVFMKSYVYHSVIPNESNEDRMCIAFNFSLNTKI
jgi:hypothetical protein